MDGKFWLDPDPHGIRIAFAYRFGPKELREVRVIIEEHFDRLISAWKDLHHRRQR